MKTFSNNDARNIVSKIGAKLSPKGVEQFRKGLSVELEHGKKGPREGLNTNVTNDDPIKTGKIALIHLKEAPNYYTALAKMEKQEHKKNIQKSIIKKFLKN